MPTKCLQPIRVSVSQISKGRVATIENSFSHVTTPCTVSRCDPGKSVSVSSPKTGLVHRALCPHRHLECGLVANWQPVQLLYTWCCMFTVNHCSLQPCCHVAASEPSLKAALHCSNPVAKIQMHSLLWLSYHCPSDSHNQNCKQQAMFADKAHANVEILT